MDLLQRLAAREEVEDERHPNTGTFDARLAGANVRVDGDAVEERGHDLSLAKHLHQASDFAARSPDWSYAPIRESRVEARPWHVAEFCAA